MLAFYFWSIIEILIISDSQMDKPFIGIIGLGYWGRNILRNLCELKAVHTACDRDKDVIEARRKEFFEIEYTQSYKDILSHPQIKAVVISTPAATHYQLAREAILAGKDVFVEKPLALNYAYGKELVDLAEKSERILMVGHILQYHPAIVKLKEIIEPKNPEIKNPIIAAKNKYFNPCIITPYYI